jgi:hypothetical protein
MLRSFFIGARVAKFSENRQQTVSRQILPGPPVDGADRRAAITLKKSSH